MWNNLERINSSSSWLLFFIFRQTRKFRKKTRKATATLLYFSAKLYSKTSETKARQQLEISWQPQEGYHHLNNWDLQRCFQIFPTFVLWFIVESLKRNNEVQLSIHFTSVLQCCWFDTSSIHCQKNWLWSTCCISCWQHTDPWCCYVSHSTIKKWLENKFEKHGNRGWCWYQ